MSVSRFLLILSAESARMRCALVLRDGRIIASAHHSFETKLVNQEWLAFDPIEVWYKSKQVIAACLDIGHVQAHELAGLALVTHGDQVVAWSVADQELDSAGIALTKAASNFTDQVPRLFQWLIERPFSLPTSPLLSQFFVGTLDNWLLWNLSGEYVASRSTAQCTGLLNSSTGQWDTAKLTECHTLLPVMPPLCDPNDSECFGHARARGPLTAELPIAAVVSQFDALEFAARQLENKADPLREQSDAAIIGTALFAAESIGLGSAL